MKIIVARGRKVLIALFVMIFIFFIGILRRFLMP